MKKKIYSRLGAVLCVCASFLWLFSLMFVTYADTAKGSLSIICKTDEGALYGMNWRIYPAAERVSADKIEFTGDFADYPVFLPDLQAASLQDAANTLENYAELDNIKPLDEKSSDASGKVLFTDLPDGIYLVTGDRLSVGSSIYIPTAMFVEITGGKAVTSFAKFTVRKKPSFDEQMYRVKKVWQYDDSFIQLRPVEIEVEIYCDNKYVETVILNKDNEWTYDWTGSSSSFWRIKEKIIDKDYKVIYRNNETQFILVNNRSVLNNSVTTTGGTTISTETLTTTETTVTETGTVTSDTFTETSDTTTETSVSTEDTMGGSSDASSSSSTTQTTAKTSGGGGKLPQTGQLWWPVPVCCGAGIILFALGWRLNKKNK